MIGAPNTTSAEVLPPRHESGARHSLEVKDLRKTYRGRAVVDGVSLGLASGEIGGPPRAERGRQDDDFLHGRGAGPAGPGFHPVRRAGHHRPADVPPGPHGDRLSSPGAVDLPEDGRRGRTSSPSWRCFPLSPEGRRARLADLLEDLGIAHLARHRAYALSGGERRRVEIARALALSPEFILLDEPFAGIDPITVSEIQKIVARLKSRGSACSSRTTTWPRRSRSPTGPTSSTREDPQGRDPGGDRGERPGEGCILGRGFFFLSGRIGIMDYGLGGRGVDGCFIIHVP